METTIKVLENKSDSVLYDEIGSHDMDLNVDIEIEGRKLEIIANGTVYIKPDGDQYNHDSAIGFFNVYDKNTELKIPFPGITNEQVADLMIEHCIK